MKWKLEHTILLLFLCAGTAAAVLGVFAFRLARHEAEFQKQQMANLLRSECKVFAERCRDTLESIKRELIRKAAGTGPEIRAIDRAVRTEPLFAEGFFTTADGLLRYPDPDSAFARRYEELFNGMISARHAESELFANIVVPADSAVYLSSRTLAKRNDSSSILPILPASPLKQKTAPKNSAGKKLEHQKRTAVRQNATPPKSLPAPAAVKQMQSSRQSTLNEIAAAESPAASEADRSSAPAMIRRFEAIIRNRNSGYIPWYNGNRFTPLVWARNGTASGGAVCGFELETTMLLAKLIPLFPDHLPSYFRIEFLDAKDKLIHSSGGERQGNTEAALIMPFSEQLLPNYQIRAYLLTDHLPRNTFHSILWMQLASLCLIILLAGGIALFLIRKQAGLARQKTNFVSQVSHELKTPLTSIRMYSELLKAHASALTDEKRNRYLNVIREESERLTRLVDNVLDFGRLETNRRKYHPQTIDLNTFLREVCANANDLVRRSGMEIRLTVPEEPITVSLDRDTLTQILHNLFDNACKYACKGKFIDVSLFPDSILVQDYGPGIPANARNKIFRQFYRIDNSLSAETSGSGLGLAISRRLLRDQGGDLVLEVKNHEGAGFRILLPPPATSP